MAIKHTGPRVLDFMILVFSQSVNLASSTCPGRLQETLMHGLSQTAPCLSGFGKGSYFRIEETGCCASSSCPAAWWLSGKGRGEPSPPASTVSHTTVSTPFPQLNSQLVLPDPLAPARPEPSPFVLLPSQKQDTCQARTASIPRPLPRQKSPRGLCKEKRLLLYG